MKKDIKDTLPKAMDNEIYQKIFEAMDNLWCVRIREWVPSFTYRYYDPVLSDCVCFEKVIHRNYRDNDLIIRIVYLWDYSQVYLKYQSDELGELLLKLIK